MNKTQTRVTFTGGGFFDSFFYAILAVMKHFLFDKVKDKVGKAISNGSALSAFLIE